MLEQVTPEVVHATLVDHELVIRRLLLERRAAGASARDEKRVSTGRAPENSARRWRSASNEERPEDLSSRLLSAANPSASGGLSSDRVPKFFPSGDRVTRNESEVTLMFSDIEGSTTLNGRLGDLAWLDLLKDHNRIFKRHVAAQGGHVVKGMGDGLMVAFPAPACAVSCALDVQNSMASEPGALGALGVRIGVHTGWALRDGADYIGRDVSYAARVASNAKPGEVLVSGSTREEIAEAAEYLISPKRLVWLKGFDGPQPVWAVARAGSPRMLARMD